MQVNKKGLLRVFFCIELITYGYYYLYGSQGFVATKILQEEIEEIQYATHHLVNSISELERSIYAWKSEPFLKEQLAREQLQLAYPEDVIYYIIKPRSQQTAALQVSE